MEGGRREATAGWGGLGDEGFLEHYRSARGASLLERIVFTLPLASRTLAA